MRPDLVVVVTGGFDPLHEGHMEYFKAAHALGKEKVSNSELWVGINSDDWLTRKKGKPFMSWNARYSIISNLRMVDKAFSFDDSDDTAIDAILEARKWNPDAAIIFANGGDRTSLNIPEMKWAAEYLPEIRFEFGVGGENKLNSSSSILRDWEFQKWKATVDSAIAI